MWRGSSKTHRPVVILVDPFSTGVLLQKRIYNAGLGVLLVWSDRTKPHGRAKHCNNASLKLHRKAFIAAEIVHEPGAALETTIDKILAVPDVELVALMCGSEFGVLLEDQLAQGLNERLGQPGRFLSSGLVNPTMKVDKFMQGETVREAGLDAAKQKLAFTDHDVKLYLADLGPSFKVVLKPQTGAGSVGVFICESMEETWHAFDTIMAGEHKTRYSSKYHHYEEAGVLLMEYLKGTEYIVNMVASAGIIKCTAIWEYDKRPYNGAPFVCFAKKLLSVDDEMHLAGVVRYTEDVVKAIGIQNGAIHAEIMYVPGRGPVLVEVNCRLHGGDAAWIHPVEICMGYSQLSVMMDAYLNGGQGAFAEIPVWPHNVQGGCYQVKMRASVAGKLKGVIPSQMEKIEALPSYLEHFFKIKPGDQVFCTVDMPSVPGEVTLVHGDKDVLEADYKELNEILHEGLFYVEEQVPMDFSMTVVKSHQPLVLVGGPVSEDDVTAAETLSLKTMDSSEITGSNRPHQTPKMVGIVTEEVAVPPFVAL